jgi:2'-5' RNA ligase
VFAAADEAEGTCSALRADLHAALDLTPEGGFRPHVTLCRPQAAHGGLPAQRDWPQLLEAHGLADWGACGTTDIVLYRSSGVGTTRYEALESWPLL